MIFKVNIDKLFREIEEKVIEEQRNIGEKSRRREKNENEENEETNKYEGSNNGQEGGK